MITGSKTEFHQAYDENDRYLFVACSCVGNDHGLLLETIPDDPDIPIPDREIVLCFYATFNRNSTIAERLRRIYAILRGKDYEYENVILTYTGVQRLIGGLQEMLRAKEAAESVKA